MFKLIHYSLITKLDHTNRFNGTPLIKNESVSQHSYWVVFYSSFILQDVFRGFLDTEPSAYYNLYYSTILRATYHDISEIITGDVIYPTKYHNSVDGKQIRESLENIFKAEIEKWENSTLKKDIDELLRQPKTIWSLAIYNISKRVVKLSDWYSCYAFLFNESRLGNRAVLNIMEIATTNIISCVHELEREIKFYGLPYSEQAIKNLLQ